MKGIAFFVVLILYGSLATAELYKQKVYDGYAFEQAIYTTSDNLSFTVGFTNENKVLFTSSQGGTIVESGKCESKFQYNYCFSGLTFDHYDYNLSSRLVYKAKVTVEKIIAKLNITREIPSEIALSEQYTVKSIIQNVADVTASNVVFSDSYPNEFDVTSASSCSVLGNNVTWKGDLQAGEKAECQYVLYAKNNVTFTSSAYADYDNGLTKATQVSTATITVPNHPVIVYVSIPNVSVELGSFVDINFTLIATKNLSLNHFSFEALRLTPVKTDKALVGSFYYTGSMDAGQNKTFVNRFLADTLGRAPIVYEVKYSLGPVSKSFRQEIPVNVSVKEPYVRISRNEFSKSSDKFSVFVVNPSNHTFYKVLLKTSGLVEENFTADKIEGFSHIEFPLRYEGKQGNHSLAISLSYKSEFGQPENFSNVEAVTIIEAKISQKEAALPSENTSSEPGESVENEVVVNVKKSAKQANKVIFILLGVVIAIILLAIIAANMRHSKPKQKEYVLPQQPDEDAPIDPLNELK